MTIKLSFYNPLFTKVMLGVDGQPQPLEFWVNMVKGVLCETTPTIYRRDVKFFVSFVDDDSAEVLLAFPDNMKLPSQLIDRLADILNTPCDYEGMIRLVVPSNFVVEPISRTAFLSALASCRRQCHFLD
jgi:hypothetical protein